MKRQTRRRRSVAIGSGSYWPGARFAPRSSSDNSSAVLVACPKSVVVVVFAVAGGFERDKSRTDRAPTLAI